MIGNIVYKIDESGDRISENWTGNYYFDNSSPNDVWMYIHDTDGNNVPLKIGDRIHYSDADLPNNVDYEIVQAEPGIYKLRRLD